MKLSHRFTGALVVCALAFALAASALLMFAPATFAAAPAVTALGGDVWSMGLLAAAIATGISSAGAGFAVARVGTAAVGALAEKPELFGRLLIFVGLAEGIAIYGLIVSILVLNRLT